MKMMNNGDASSTQQTLRDTETSAPTPVEKCDTLSEMDDYEKQWSSINRQNNAILAQ